MKILHIWDQSGVACILAKYQRRLGNECMVVKRNGFDPFGIMKFYDEKILNVKFNRIFSFLVIKKAKEYDIIHIHDLYGLAASIREKYPTKKIFLHYHGSTLRSTPRNILEKYEKKVDRVLISTPDLLDFVDGYYLPNPVDIEHFHPRNIESNGKALSIMSKWESQEEIEKILKLKNIFLDVKYHNRESKPLKYSDIPNYLSKFEYLIDFKLVYDSRPIPAFSSLGLQSLSLGLKIINYKSQIEVQFPIQHHPKKVTRKLMDLYNEI